MSFAILSSGDDTGMPTDVNMGPCPSGDRWRRWQVSTAIAELLTSITFDYDGSGTAEPGLCGACCFRYSARKDYTYDAADDNTCGSPFTIPQFLFGDAPFETQYFDGFYQHYKGTESADNEGCLPCVPPEDPDPTCCWECQDPSDVSGTEFINWDGLEISYTPIIGDASLDICVSGQVVSICGTITMYMGIIGKEGTYAFGSGGTTDGVYPDCPGVPETLEDDTTVGCTADEIATFPFSMSADLTAVSGANLWEKIKNYTDWQFDYAYGVCGTAVGCTSGTEICIGPVSILPNCFVFHRCEDCSDTPTTTPGETPADQVCLYNFGTLGVTFADG